MSAAISYTENTAIDRWIAPATERIATCLGCGHEEDWHWFEGCTFGHPEVYGETFDDEPCECERFE